MQWTIHEASNLTISILNKIGILELQFHDWSVSTYVIFKLHHTSSCSVSLFLSSFSLWTLCSFFPWNCLFSSLLALLNCSFVCFSSHWLHYGNRKRCFEVWPPLISVLTNQLLKLWHGSKLLLDLLLPDLARYVAGSEVTMTAFKYASQKTKMNVPFLAQTIVFEFPSWNFNLMGNFI